MKPSHLIGVLLLGLVATSTTMSGGEPSLQPKLVDAAPNNAEKRAAEQPTVEKSNAEPSRSHIVHEQQEIEGWSVMVDASLLGPDADPIGPEALKVLSHQLYRISLVLPAQQVTEMRKVVIFLDREHPLTSLQYHPNAGWLKEHGYDVAMKQAVHIPRARGLVDHARKNVQPWVMLHELAHAYHDQVLSFDNVTILKAFENVREAKSYESTLHIRGHRTKHYALTNHKEYFAEMTEAYFGTNDFFPFTYGEIKDSDPTTFEMLETIWGKRR